MPVKKGLMFASVSRSIRSMTFKEHERWGVSLMLTYANQIDRAERLKHELGLIQDVANTASKTWYQRLERLEKYINADSIVANIGPKLLTLMKEFGMTPVMVKPASYQNEVQGGGKNDGGSSTSQATEEVEDELAKLRAERGKHTRTG